MFSLLYQAHHSLHSEDLSFWQELAAQSPGPILELGCGAGRVLLALAQAGHPVCGLDNDPDMLAVLHDNLGPELQPRPLVLQADFTQYHLERQFGLILLPCNTFSTLSSEARQNVLQCTARHLRPGGLFAVSMPNPPLLEQIPARAETEVEEFFPHPLDGEPVQVSSAWERTSEHLIIHWHYDHLLPDGRIHRVSAEVKHYLVSPQIYLEEIRSAELEPRTIYGDYDRSALTHKSPQMIILASK